MPNSVEAALAYPVYGDAIEPACPYIRVGRLYGHPTQYSTRVTVGTSR